MNRKKQSLCHVIESCGGARSNRETKTVTVLSHSNINGILLLQLLTVRRNSLSSPMNNMDDELLKRNTDCVYFLASPFTCKKGVECEYRHSEMARLNPRDCWYWLSGECLNPSCGFRHPPVDMLTKAPTEAELLLNDSSCPPRKNSVPCYFYFNKYFCNKGDKCPFLHGPEDLSGLNQEEDSAVVHTAPVDDKIPPESSNHIIPDELSDKLPIKMLHAKVPSRTEPVLDPPEKFPAVLKRFVKTANELPQKKLADISSTLERRNSPHCSEFEYEETTMMTSESLNPSPDVIKSDPSISSEQFSEEKIDNVVQDELWVSSPDLDVLVERRAEATADVDDQEEYMIYEDCYVRNAEDVKNIIMDHSYQDQRVLRVREPVYDSDDEDIIDIVGYSDGHRGVNHILSQKRKVMNVGWTSGGRYDEDLREHLTKRRFLDDHLERHETRFAFKRCNLPVRFKERRGRPQRRIPSQNFHGRLALNFERSGFRRPMQKSAVVIPDQRREVWNSQLNRQNHHKYKKHKFPSSVQRTTFSGRKGEYENTISFSGPKSLAQIKEEKYRPKADSTGRSAHIKSVGFEGPKPLNEILKDKKKVNNDGSSSV